MFWTYLRRELRRRLGVVTAVSSTSIMISPTGAHREPMRGIA